MKFLFVVLIFFLALATAHRLKLSMKQKLTVFYSALKCSKKHGVSNSQALALSNGDFKEKTPNIKCFVDCYLNSFGFIKNGKVQPKVVLTKMSPIVGKDIVKKIQAKCDALKGADNCDTAFKIYECYYKNHEQLLPAP